MLPVIAIIGRPNVGKSTLFNYLTKSKDALVADFPGLTRDRQYGFGKVGDEPYMIVDTGGMLEPDDPEMAASVNEQIDAAIEDADQVLFLVDGKDGLMPLDEMIVERLRDKKHKVRLIVNKVDRGEKEMFLAEFYGLGFQNPIAIGAERGRGVEGLMNTVIKDLPPAAEGEVMPKGIKVSIIGRPNVGKSTLINRMLGEDRLVVMDRPGTTRDSIAIPFKHHGTDYVLIDTAGVRRRSKVDEGIEKFSVIKTIRAIETSDIVVILMDAELGIADQDLKLIGLALRMGRAIILGFNKWDKLTEADRDLFKDMIDRKLAFVEFARRYFMSALHGSGVGKLYHAIDEAYGAAHQEISTNKLTNILYDAIEKHQPPLSKGRRIKPRLAHIGAKFPFTIVIHGKQVEVLLESYQRFLAGYFRDRLGLVGTPIVIKMLDDNNPFDPRNKSAD